MLTGDAAMAMAAAGNDDATADDAATAGAVPANDAAKTNAVPAKHETPTSAAPKNVANATPAQNAAEAVDAEAASQAATEELICYAYGWYIRGTATEELICYTHKRYTNTHTGIHAQISIKHTSTLAHAYVHDKQEQMQIVYLCMQKNNNSCECIRAPHVQERPTWRFSFLVIFKNAQNALI